MLKKVIDFLRSGDSSTFNAAEMRILSFLLDALPNADRTILSSQIEAVSLVQRRHPGRLVVAYYPKSRKVRVLPYAGYEHCLANVSYKSNGKTKTTSLVLHDGRLMSFERAVPESLESVDSLVKVELHPKGFSSVAAEINAEEHGDSA